MKVIWFFILGHILNKVIAIWFFKPHLFLKMSKCIAGHVIKTWFLIVWITSFLTQIFHVNFKGNVEKMMCYLLLTANLSVTIEWLTRYKQKVVSAISWRARVCPRRWYPIQIILLYWKNRSAIKYLRLKFGV